MTLPGATRKHGWETRWAGMWADATGRFVMQSMTYAGSVMLRMTEFFA